MAINGNGADSRVSTLLRAGVRRTTTAEDAEPVRTAPPNGRTALRFLRSSPVDATQPILAAREFERFLERERSLADRGTRRFSLMVIGSRHGHRRDLSRLARPLRQRLRSTDLVGQLDADRLGLLLTDTDPVGAGAVARWVEATASKLGIAIDATIYVYPSVDEAADRPEPHENGGSSSRPSGAAPGHNGHEHNGHEHNGHAQNGHAQNGHAHGDHEHRRRAQASPVGADAHACGGVAAPPWPMEDLWRHLSVPLPLWKRCADIALSSLALLVLSPLLVLAAIAIRIDSRGAVIYRSTRAGRGAQPFVLYKFRSMIAGAEQQQADLESRNEQDGPIFKIRDDPRITRIGRLLRCSSIDELPQLWNILKGDITLVGPRSPTFHEVSKYQRWQRRRLSVMGGVTCIWQVSGRSHVAFQDWMRMDMRYIARGSAWMDLALLLRTLPAVISGRGAY